MLVAEALTKLRLAGQKQALPAAPKAVSNVLLSAAAQAANLSGLAVHAVGVARMPFQEHLLDLHTPQPEL
jgi:hypothetical protein